MVRIDYDVIFHPLRLNSPAVTSGKSYAVHFSRRDLAFLSNIERCRTTGEVVFAAASDPVTHAPSQVVFTEAMERRTVTVELCDFTNQRSPQRLGGSSFDLVDVCDVSSRQKARKRIEIRFRIGGKEAVLEFVLVMTPAGQTPLGRGGGPQPSAATTGGGGARQPPPQQQQLSGAGSRSAEPQMALPGDVCRLLFERGLIGGAAAGGRDVEVVMDEDIGTEVVARARQLMGVKRPAIDRAPAALLRRRDELLSEVRALESVLDSAGSGGERDMTQLLREELMHWQRVVFEQETARVRAEYDYQARRTQAAAAAAVASSSSKNSSARATTTSAPESLVADLQAQRQVLQDALLDLNDQQAHRDVTREASELIESIDNLSKILDEAEASSSAAEAQATTASGHGSASSSSLQQKWQALTSVEIQQLSALAEELLAAEVALELNQHAHDVARAIVRQPPCRDGPAAPSTLKCMSSAPLFTLPSSATGSSTNITKHSPPENSATRMDAPVHSQPRDPMADLFSSFAATPLQHQPVDGPAPPANSRPTPAAAVAPCVGVVDSLFIPPTQAVTVAETAPKRVAEFGAPMLTPSALSNVRCAVAPAEIEFGSHSSSKSLMGYQVHVTNGGSLPLVLQGAKVVIEDLFSAHEVEVEGVVYPRVLTVGPGGSSAVLCFGAFNQALLVCRGTMSLSLRASATVAGGDSKIFSIRLPSH